MRYEIMSPQAQEIISFAENRFFSRSEGPPAGTAHSVLLMEQIILESELYNAITAPLSDKQHILLCVQVALRSVILKYFELGRENEIPPTYRHLYL